MAVINFIPTGDMRYASSRIRAFWPAEHMKDAYVSPPKGKNGTEAEIQLIEADTYIWQKFLHFEFMAANPDAKHIWDLCDPLWWFSPEFSRMALQNCSEFICSTPALADEFHNWSGLKAHVVPDRMNMEHFTSRRIHVPRETVGFVWFGMGVNRMSLLGAWANLARLVANGHKVSLTIIDDMPEVPLGFGDELGVYNVQWKLDYEVALIAQHDIALLPPYPGPWGALKSNNKRLTAWGCGLPAIDGFNYQEMLALVESHETRQSWANVSLNALVTDYDVKESAKELEEICNG